MITPEQVEVIKKQLISKVDSFFPKDKRDFAISQIESMTPEELEEFLKNNELSIQQGTNQCIFCSIVSGDIPSYKIDENEDTIAVLEINPVSKGHALIIPKKHLPTESETSSETSKLIEKISKKINSNLKPIKLEIHPSELMGHKVVNILPIYHDENIDSPRKKAEESELKDLQEKIMKEEPKRETAKKEKPASKPKKKKEEKLWLPKRIP
ncbi:MAG: HIT domain-containing protein [Nanoarchaeota archaeon]|nr:HIT domain-containing protein [Nanoarchaeota archaeon]